MSGYAFRTAIPALSPGDYGVTDCSGSLLSEVVRVSGRASLLLAITTAVGAALIRCDSTPRPAGYPGN